MSTLNAITKSYAGKLCRFLAGLKQVKHPATAIEQLEFPFGMKRDFHVNQAVKRKHRI